MILVSTWATPDLDFSLGKVISLTHSLLLFFAVVAAARRGARQRHVAVAGLLLGGLGVAGLSLLGAQWASKLPLLGGLIARLPERLITLPGSPAGGFSPNQVAGVLLWVTPPALALGAAALRRRSPGLPRWLTWSALPAALLLNGDTAADPVARRLPRPGRRRGPDGAAGADQTLAPRRTAARRPPAAPGHSPRHPRDRRVCCPSWGLPAAPGSTASRDAGKSGRGPSTGWRISPSPAWA